MFRRFVFCCFSISFDNDDDNNDDDNNNNNNNNNNNTKAAGCGSISVVISSIVLLCVS